MDLKELTQEPSEFVDVPNIHVQSMIASREFRLQKNIALFNEIKHHGDVKAIASYVARTRAAIEELHRNLDNLLEVRDWRLDHGKMEFDEAAGAPIEKETLEKWLKDAPTRQLMDEFAEHEMTIEELQRLVNRASNIRITIADYFAQTGMGNIEGITEAEKHTREELQRTKDKLLLIEAEIKRRQNAQTAEFDVVLPEHESTSGENI